MDHRAAPAQKLYPYSRNADQAAETTARHPVVVVGGGPVGLALALDLGLRNVPVVLLDDHEGVGEGSRAICFAKRTLEIAGRLGCGRRMVEKGVVWSRGRVFHDRSDVFEFDLLPEDGHEYPAFINLPQPDFERLLVERIRDAQDAGAPIDLRGMNRVSNIAYREMGVALDVETPDGPYHLEAEWLIACDGARSPSRGILGLGFEGRVFEDNFLIADIRMTSEDFPTERWFWFEPYFKSGASALLHRQPDGIWRVDFQIGWDIDRETELRDANVRRRLDAMLGPDVEYDLVWTSIYTFQCRRMSRFRHDRVIFAGDAAHQVSPFGARGANSGIQDADNLGWKLAMVVRGEAPERLLDSYDEERVFAADENILHSTRSTDFITPKSAISRTFRNAVLDLAKRHTFARPLVNAGRLSMPSIYEGLSHVGPDALPEGPRRSRPGSACPDASTRSGFLLSRLQSGFTLLTIDAEAPDESLDGRVLVRRLALSTSDDHSRHLADRFLGTASSAVYLIRPDGHVAARWAAFEDASFREALRRSCGKD